MNILFTSVGRRSYLVEYFKKSLGDKGKVYVANSTDISPAFEVADGCVVSPLIYDDSYIPFLLDYCRKMEISAVIPLFDIDLLILARNKQRFTDIGVTVVVSDEGVIDICNDKWRTYLFGKENGIGVPATYLSLEDSLSAIRSGEVSFPLIVKPRWGMGSIAIYQADDEEELRVFYNKTFKGIKDSYLKYEAAMDIDHCVIIQEKAKGEEYGLDIIDNLNSEYQTTIVKHKMGMRAGETDCAMVVEDKALSDFGKKISMALGHVGNLDVDIMVDGEDIKVLDMNARFGGGYPFSHMAGANLPEAILNWLAKEETSADVFDVKYNVLAQKNIQIVELKRHD